MTQRQEKPERTRWQSVRWSSVVLVLLGMGAIALAVPFVSWRWIQQPFPGLLFEHTLIISGTGSRDYGVEAPPNPTARLAAVDGEAVTNSRDLGRILQEHSVGDTVALTLEQRDSAAPLALEVVLQEFTMSDWLSLFWLPYTVGIIYLGIGVWVFWHRGSETSGQSFALLCAFVALATCAFFDLNTTHIFVRVWTASIPLIAAALLHVALVFPEEGPIVCRYSWLRLLPYSLAIILIAFAEVRLYDPADPWSYIDPWRLNYIALGLAAISFFALMLYTRARTLSSIVRQQVRIILMGSLLAFLPIVVYMILAGLGSNIPFLPVLYLPPLILFPTFIAFTILRYKLLGMDLVISRGLAYTILVAAIAGTYFLVLAVLGQAVGIQTAYNPLLLALAVVILIFILNPLREGTERLADRLLGRQRIDFRQSLQEFSRELATVPLELPLLQRRLLSQIEPVSHSAPAAIYLYDRRLDRYTLRQHSGLVVPEQAGRDLDPSNALIRWFDKQDQPLYLQGDDKSLVEQTLKPRDQAALEALGLVLFVPMHGKKHLDGWVGLGPRLSGEPYSPDDLSFLSALVDQTAIAIENAQLLLDLEQRVIQVDALRQISEAVDLRRELDDLLDLIYQQTARVLGVDNFYVALYNQDRHEFRFAYYVEEKERRQPETLTWPLGTGLSSQIVYQRQPIVTDNYLVECERRGIPASGNPAKAWLGVPLATSERILGVLNVSSFEQNYRYTPEHIQIVSAIADQAAVAIDRMHLYQETQTRAAELATLNEISRTINSTLELSSVLDLIMSKVVELLDVEAGSLLLVDEETEDLVFQVALRGSDHVFLSGRHHPMGKGIVGHAAQHGQTLIVNDVEADPRWNANIDQDTGFVTHSILCVPMFSRDQVIGVIEVINHVDGSPFTEEEARQLNNFAAQAAVAIENARLYTQTDQALARRVDELSTMQRIDRELNAALDLDRVMGLTLDWALRGTGAPVGVVALYDEAQQGLFLLASRGYPASFDRYQQELWPLGEGIAGRVIRTGTPALVEDVTQDPNYRPIQPTTRSQLTVPIRREDRVIGVVNLESPELGAFDEGNMNFTQRLSDHAAIAIENAQLHAETERQVHEQVALRQAGAVMSSALDLDVVLSRIAEQMGRAIDATSAYICGYDHESNASTVIAEYISPQAGEKEQVSDLGTCYLDEGDEFLETLQAGKHDISQIDDPELGQQERTHMEQYGAQTILYIPLRVRDRLIGYTELWESRQTREFTEQEIALCQGIAQQAAIALENARLYQESQQRAEEMSLLHDISLAVSAHLSLDEVLETVHKRISDMWAPPVFFIALYDGEDDALDFAIYLDRGEALEPFRHHLAEKPGFSAWIVRNRQPILIRDWQKEAEDSPVQGIPIGDVTRSWLGVPLIAADRMVGVMSMQDYAPNAYDQAHVRFMSIIASQVTIAIENARLYQGVKEANQAKSEFIDFVAHELKQPMTAMQGYAKMLMMGIGGEMNDTQKQFVDVITSNVDRMGKLVNDLLEISRLEAGRIKLDLMPIHLQGVVKETVTNTRTEIEARQHTLEVEVPEDLPPVLGDRERLIQVLTNLVSNAYKYTPEGGTIRITVNGREDTGTPPDHLLVSVRDTGIGMSPDDIANLEEKFYRADHDLVHTQPGTGLGVSITRNLVELHGGEFMVESEEGVGSTFSFTVPLAGGATQ